MTTDEPGVATQAPQSAEITAYDEAHFVTYLRLLDASAAGVSEEEMCRLILGIDPAKEPERAGSALRSHLARAHWMTSEGYHFMASRPFGWPRSSSPYACGEGMDRARQAVSVHAGDDR